MIKASALILSIRQKLNDNDPDNYKYFNPEIIDAINSGLKNISNDLLYFSRVWKIKCKEDQERYDLPEDFLKPIRVLLNGKKIFSVKSQKSDDTLNAIVFDDISIRLYVAHKDDDVLDIEYNYIEQIDTTESDIFCSLLLYDAIIYYALSILFQNPIKKDGLERGDYFLSKYNREVNNIKDTIRSNRQTQNIKTKFKGI